MIYDMIVYDIKCGPQNIATLLYMHTT